VPLPGVEIQILIRLARTPITVLRFILQGLLCEKTGLMQRRNANYAILVVGINSRNWELFG
jgi:hypothetical protein